MTLAEKAAKLTEFSRQMRDIETAIIESGLDDELIKEALESVAKAGSELRASRHVVNIMQRMEEQAA